MCKNKNDCIFLFKVLKFQEREIMKIWVLMGVGQLKIGKKFYFEGIIKIWDSYIIK